ncbi:MAG: tRNA (adenosine(37)-N6)-dimethylallyltransferase MiaA [Pseudomonadota bacterium]
MNAAANPVCIMGPTAAGKTELATALAAHLDGELISVDSALVYKGLDVGSAKPSYPHHLIDICDPREVYSAASFVRDAQNAMELIKAKNKRSILVGGSMLYFKALLHGLDPLPGADQELRKALTNTARREGWPAIHADLARRDPETAKRIHPNHSHRLLRALELNILTGKRLAELHGGKDAGARRLAAEPIPCFALSSANRAVLHYRIERRLDDMLTRGFLEEVRSLLAMPGMHLELPSLRAVGYRQLARHLLGDYDLNEARQRALAATRQLAKRQLTWLRKWPGLIWILTDSDGLVVQHGPREALQVCDSGHSPVEIAQGYLRAI